MNIHSVPVAEEFAQKLTCVIHPGGHWVICLPIGVNPNEVSPPCFVTVGVQNLNVQYRDGMVMLIPPEPLHVSEIIEFLTTVDIHKFPPVPPLSVAHTINNAVQFLCTNTGIPVPK
jgi:hypothetical protein